MMKNMGNCSHEEKGNRWWMGKSSKPSTLHPKMFAKEHKVARIQDIAWIIADISRRDTTP